MKVIYLHQYFRTPAMSGGTRSYEMARRMVKAGHEVHIVTSWQDACNEKGWFTEKLEGIFVHWLPVPYSNRMTFSQRLRAFFRFAFLAKKKVVDIGGDIVFATSTPLTIAFPGVLGARKLRVPMVFEVRDLWPNVPIALGVLKNPILKIAARFLERWAYKNSTHVIALSEGMRDGVANAGYPLDKISVIPNSADLELFQSPLIKGDFFDKKIPDSRGRKKIVYAGTFGVVNGVEYLVRLAAESASQGFDDLFIALGDGAHRELVEKKARELGVYKENFWILPPCAKSEMPEVMKGADLSLSLVINNESLWVNSANKFFDSLAASTPIAINYGGWQANVINETRCGIILDPLDIKSAARSIHVFLGSQACVESARVAALDLAKTRYARDILADKLIAVLEKAVRTKLQFK